MIFERKFNKKLKFNERKIFRYNVKYKLRVDSVILGGESVSAFFT